MAIAKLAGIGDKLEGIQGKLDVVSDLFENPIGDFAENLLGGIDFGDFGIPSAVTGLFDKIPDFPGLEIGLDQLSGFGSCFANLDDLIADMLKEKIVDMILSFPPGMAAANLMSSVFSTISVVQEVIDDVISLTQLSLRDLIMLAQNSDFLQRIAIIKKITDLYENVIQNINDFISTIMDLDPCNLINYRPGRTTPAPKPATMPEGPPAPPPTPMQNFAKNSVLSNVVDGFIDAKWKIGQVLSKDKIEENDPDFKATPQFNSAMAHLHHVAHSFRKQVEKTQRGDSERIIREIEIRADESVKRKAEEWGEEAKNWFVYKLNQLTGTLRETAPQLYNMKTAQADPITASKLGPSDGVEDLDQTVEGFKTGDTPPPPADSYITVDIPPQPAPEGGFPPTISIPWGELWMHSPLRGEYKYAGGVDGQPAGTYLKTDNAGFPAGLTRQYEELSAEEARVRTESATNRIGLTNGTFKQNLPQYRPAGRIFTLDGVGYDSDQNN